jgi:diaminopimelate decarboxylase
MTTHNSERVSVSLGGCDPSVLAREFGTPLVVVDEVCLRSRMRRFQKAFSRPGWTSSVTYAGKALLLAAIARIAHEEGLAIDVCSLGELQTALRGGVPADRCIVHGCFKTPEELEAAVKAQVRHVVVDHAGEIDDLARIANANGVTCDVLLRVNPGITAHTHELVQTSAPASKFGFAVADGPALAAVRAVRAEKSLHLSGIHCHLGSQIFDLRSYARAVDALVGFAQSAFDECGATFSIVDVGGGLAVDGDDDESKAPSPDAWAGAIFDAFDACLAGSPLQRPHVYVEPGRALIASAGTTLYRIGVRKRLPDGAVALIVDGGMSDNPRPALYEARYRVSIAGRPDAPPDGSYVVFGRHCETDRLFPDAALPNPQPGDLLEVRDTGAYTYSMASNYNRFVRPAVVIVNDAGARLAAARETLDHVLALDVVESP